MFHFRHKAIKNKPQYLARQSRVVQILSRKYKIQLHASELQRGYRMIGLKETIILA